MNENNQAYGDVTTHHNNQVYGDVTNQAGGDDVYGYDVPNENVAPSQDGRNDGYVTFQ